jgi:hypothetical protein
MSINSGGITSIVKATTGNVGMSSGNGYISATNSNVQLGITGSNKKISIADDMIALYYKVNTAQQGQNNNGQYLALETENGLVKLVCYGIPPAQQSGIYARFA